MDYTQKTCREFVSVLASNEPAPGGGGASALVAAIGTALGNMVGALTVGKKKYAQVEDEIKQLMTKCDALQEELLQQVPADAEGFLPLAAAYAIPKDDPHRAETLEQATVAACRVPLRIMELCCEALDCVRVFAEKGSRLALSDAGCAAAMLNAALQSAALNVFINTKAMHSRETAEELNLRCLSMLEQYTALADDVFLTVQAQFLEE